MLHWAIKIFIFGQFSFMSIFSYAETKDICSEQNRIVVTSENIHHFHAHLELYLQGQLKMSIPVHIGRNGVGWHHPFIEPIDTTQIPEKQEGDGKTPLGKYLLKTEFGFSQSGQTGFSYQNLNQNIECVDDVQSIYYNQIIDISQIKKQDWNSSEKMSKIPEYQYGFNIEYPSQREKKQGSCLFVHTLLNPLKGTAGCIALPVKDILIMNRMIQESKIVQIPIIILSKKVDCH